MMEKISIHYTDKATATKTWWRPPRGILMLLAFEKHAMKEKKELKSDSDLRYWLNSPRLWKYQIKRVTVLHIKGESLLGGLLIRANKDLRWEV